MNGTIVSRAAASGSTFLQACRQQLFPSSKHALLNERLQAAYNWLCRAQDVTGDGGVSAWYHLVRGWSTSYPETTGYTIPTFLTYGQLLAEPEAKRRAIQMADFECNVQLPSGAVRGGQMAGKAAPAVFNTGQVLFGWVAAYQATGERRYAEAAIRAAEWLVRGQDNDGAWRKDLSPLTTSTVQTYNVRTAWALILAGQVLNEPRWIQAGRQNCDWALGQQLRNGWFTNDSFGQNEDPLLHTIAYTLEGLLGAGELLGEQNYVEACELGIAPLVTIFLNSKGLKGRYNENWRSSVGWRCPTGEAQLAVVLNRLRRHGIDSSFGEAARGLLEGVSAIQNIAGANPEIHGAISGAVPFWAMYCPFKYVNWAAKFYMDAVMLDLFQCDVHEKLMHSSRADRLQ